MRYLILILFLSCNADHETAKTIEVRPSVDSLIKISDSVSIKTVALESSLDDLQSKMEDLVLEKQQLQEEVNREEKRIIPAYVFRDSIIQDSRDKIIADLRNRLNQKENEIASLKRQLDYKPQLDIIPDVAALDIEKPNDKSLVIELDKDFSGSLEIYLIPFSKKVKSLMQLEISCDVRKINSLKGRKASFYGGKFFFNDVPEGKYLLKNCYYYGGFIVVDRKDEYQVIKLQVK